MKESRHANFGAIEAIFLQLSWSQHKLAHSCQGRGQRSNGAINKQTNIFSEVSVGAFRASERERKRAREREREREKERETDRQREREKERERETDRQTDRERKRERERERERGQKHRGIRNKDTEKYTIF